MRIIGVIFATIGMLIAAPLFGGLCALLLIALILNISSIVDFIGNLMQHLIGLLIIGVGCYIIYGMVAGIGDLLISYIEYIDADYRWRIDIIIWIIFIALAILAFVAVLYRIYSINGHF
jgi:hypothetical protein